MAVIGVAEGILRLRDEFTSAWTRAVHTANDANKKLVADAERISKSYDKTSSALKRLAADLDPNVSKSLKYSSAQETLNTSLKKGEISQEEYNRLLDAAKIKYLDVGRGAEQYGEKLKKLGGQLSNVGSQLTQKVTLPLVALSGSVIKVASDFESSFAGVRKTVDATEEELSQLSQGLRDLAAGPKPIPIDVDELNAIAESAGQLGIKKQDILDFTKVMADLGETTNLTSLEAAESLAQFQNIFGQAGKEVDRLGSTIVALGNDGASTERDIVSMGLRIAGAGNQLGLTQGEVLAFASALSSVGIEAEAGGSAISKVMIDMALAVSKGGRELHDFEQVAKSALPSGKSFVDLFREDAATAVVAFIEGLGRMKESGQDVLGTLDAMGITEVRMRDALLRGAGAGDLLTRSLKLQAQAWQENNALTNEAQKRYQTFESQLTIFWNRIKDIGITLGQSLLPILVDTLDVLEPMIKTVAALAKEFADAPSGVKAVTLALVGLASAAGPVLFVTGQLITAWGTLITTAPRVAAAIKLALAPAAIVAAGIVIYAVIDGIIDRWRKASEAAIDYQVQTGNLQGRLLSFVNQVNQSGGGIQTSSTIARAREDLKQLSIELNAAQDRLTQLKSQRQFQDPGREAGREDIRLQQEEVNRLSATYERAKKAISSVGAVIDDTKKPVEDLSGSFNNLSGGVNILSEENEQLASDLAKLRAELIRTAAQNKEFAASFGKTAQIERSETEKRVRAIQKSHDLHNAYLEDVATFGKAAAQALQPLREADYDAAQAADDAQESFRSITSAVQDAGRTISEFFKDKLKSDIESGTQVILTDVKKIVDSLNLKKQLGNDAQFAIRVSAIDEATPRLRQIEEEYLSFLRDLGQGSVSEGENIIAKMGEKYRNELRLFLEQISDARILTSFEGAGDSSLTRLRSRRAEIQRIMDQSARDVTLSEERKAQIQRDGFAEINNITQQMWSEQLSHWSNALGYLADRFGGFFSYLNQLVQGIQGAQSFGSSVSQIAGGIAGVSATTGWAAALGSAATVFAIYYEVYKLVSDYVKKQRLKKYGTDVKFELSAGVENHSFFHGKEKELVNSLRDLVRSIEEALGVIVTDLEQIGIRVRNDGKKAQAYLHGVLLGEFNNVQEAIETAMLAAFKDPDTNIRGLSELMREGLRVHQSDLDELTRFLSQLKEIGDLGLPQGALQVRELVRHLEQLWLALGRLREATPAVIAGFQNLIRAESTTWEQWRRSILGIEETGKEKLARLQAEAKIYNAEKALRILELKDRRERLREEIEQARIRANLGGVGGRIGRILLQHQQEELKVRGAMVQVSASITEAQITLLDAQLEALDDLIAALEAIPDINLDDIKLPRLGGGFDNFADGVRNFIKDRSFQLGISTLSDYARRVAEINRQYEEQLSQAGRDVGLRDQLITLKEQELKLLAQEQARATVASFRDFLGLVTPFEQVRQTAAGLIKQIEESPFGDVRKARMIGRVLAETDRQLTRLSRESAVSIFGQMIQDLEKFGAEESLLSEARKHLAILEHTLKLEHFKTEIAILKAEGKLSEEVLATLQKSLDFLSNIDPTSIFSQSANWRDLLHKPPANQNDSTNDAAEKLADTIQKARDLLKKYQEDGLDPLSREIHQINQDFQQIRSALGDTSEVILAHHEAIRRAIESVLDPIRQVQRDLFFGEESPADTLTQWSTIQQEFADIQRRFRAGDLSSIEDIPDMVQQFLAVAREVTPIGSEAYRNIFTDANRFLNEVLALTPENLGSPNNPMSVAGVSDLAAISEAQLDTLTGIYRSNERVAVAVESLNSKVIRGSSLANVA